MRRLIALACCGLVAGAAAAQEADVERGRALAEAQCGRCHAVGRTGESRLPAAPPFRRLHERYPVENLEEALGEGLVTAHSAMHEFRFEPDQIVDFIAYLKTLER